MKSSEIRSGVMRVFLGNDCYATSAVIFKRKTVFCPALPIFGNILKDSDLESVLRCLDQDQPYTFYDDVPSQFKDLRCTIVVPGGKEEVPVTPKFIFHSKEIRSTFTRLLRKSSSIRLSKDDTLSPDQRALLLSTFFVCELTKSMDPDTFTESHLPPGVIAGDCSVIATPYGNSIMQGSAFNCRVANVIGVLYLLDQPLSKGCEGGLLLSSNSDPLAMILTTTFESQKENLNLTFAADLGEILKGLNNASGTGKVAKEVFTFPPDSALKHVVLIESGGHSYGTGVLLKVRNRRLILTCSHVVTQEKDNHCTWKGKRYPIRLIYKNPIFDRPFDVAVFAAPKEIPSTAFCISSKSNPILGSSVKSIGFPVFDPLAVHDLNIQPSVYHGKLVNYRAGMIISDVMIQAGQSGSPLFNQKDELVGIVVSNFRENDTGRVFPALNCAVPLFNIISYLTEYAESNDVKCLKKLEGSAYLQRLWNFEEPVPHCKM